MLARLAGGATDDFRRLREERLRERATTRTLVGGPGLVRDWLHANESAGRRFTMLSK